MRVQEPKETWIDCCSLALQTVQIKSDLPVKDSFQDRILVIYFWTFSDIHSSHMMPKLATIDKRYSSADVSDLDIRWWDSMRQTSSVPRRFRSLFCLSILRNTNTKSRRSTFDMQLKNSPCNSLSSMTRVYRPGNMLDVKSGRRCWSLDLTVNRFSSSKERTMSNIWISFCHWLWPITNLSFLRYRWRTSQRTCLALGQVNMRMTRRWQTRRGESFLGSKAMNFTYPSHVCVTSHGHLCISYAGSNQLVFCQMDGKVLVSLMILLAFADGYLVRPIGSSWQWSSRHGWRRYSSSWIRFTTRSGRI